MSDWGGSERRGRTHYQAVRQPPATTPPDTVRLEEGGEGRKLMMQSTLDVIPAQLHRGRATHVVAGTRSADSILFETLRNEELQRGIEAVSRHSRGTGRAAPPIHVQAGRACGG